MNESLGLPSLSQEEWARIIDFYDVYHLSKLLEMEDYLREVRRPFRGALDIAKTAVAANVEVEYMTLEQPGYFGFGTIFLNESESRKSKLITFGHELGHHFLKIKTGFSMAEPIRRNLL